MTDPTPNSTLARQTAISVGRELLRLRRERGMSQSEVSEALAEIGEQVRGVTIGTYERAERTLSVDRLASLLHVYGVRLDEFWATVGPLVYGEEWLQVDVRKLISLTGHRLAPVRAWARAQWDHGRGSPVVRVVDSAVVNLAELCGVGADELRAALNRARPITE